MLFTAQRSLMFLFSVAAAILHGLTASKCNALRPCLDIIKPTLDSDPDEVQEAVIQHFCGTESMLTAIKIGNYVRNRLQYLQTLPSDVVSKIQHQVGVFIFLDDSNLWITAKQAACDTRLSTNFDPRIRLDMGKLIALILDDRLLLRCRIYGSEPPAHDTFWKMYEKFSAEVSPFPEVK